MKDDTRVNKDYKEAFNQGYELSKELNLKPNVLKDIYAGNNRMLAMKDGMEQYQKDITIEKTIIPPFDMDSVENDYTDIDTTVEDKDKDVGMDL